MEEREKSAAAARLAGMVEVRSGQTTTPSVTSTDHSSPTSHTRHATPMTSKNSQINFGYLALNDTPTVAHPIVASAPAMELGALIVG